MNLEKVFNFIKEKRGYDVPLKYKLINGLPLSDDELNIKGSLNLNNTNIKSLPDNLYVGGGLGLFNTNITSLPNNLHVGRNLYLRNTKIALLPDNLHVEGDLDLGYTDIESLPDNLKVGVDLYLENTPLSKKYSIDQIRKMIEDKGGFVKRDIYI